MKKLDKRIIIAIIVIIVIIIAVSLPNKVKNFKLIDWEPVNNKTPNLVITKPGNENKTEDSKKISEAIEQIRKDTQFPQRIDEITIWTNISIENGQIVYDYKLDQTDTTNITSENLKPIVKEWICSITSIKEVLKTNTTINYRYRDYKNNIIASFTINKNDCA